MLNKNSLGLLKKAQPSKVESKYFVAPEIASKNKD